MEKLYRNTWFAWLLLMVFISSGATVATHALHFSESDAHLHSENADHHSHDCTICAFATTPFIGSERIYSASITHNICVDICVEQPRFGADITLYTSFLRGPPRI